MNSNNQIAQRLESYDSQSLVDFFTIHLPCQILIVDTVGIKRRNMSATTEFILKSISVGLTSSEDISGLLGLRLDHCNNLLAELTEGEYIGKDTFGGYGIWRRGKELLLMEGESAPNDRRISMVWDPLCKRFLGRVTMYTRKKAGRDGIFVPLAGAFGTPDLLEIGATALKEAQTNVSGGHGGRPSDYNVLRVTTIQKSLGRYREAVALVYKTERGDFSLRIATDGNIDKELTSACAQASVAKLVGVDKSFASKQGALAVRKRYKDLSISAHGSSSLESVVQRRSVLRFKITALDLSLSESDSDDLRNKRNSAHEELCLLNAKLELVPVVPVRCYEIRDYTLSTLKNAQHHVVITTTTPTEDKFDNEMFVALQKCLDRKVDIRIYIADRPSEDSNTLARLDKLSQSSFLNVYFLSNEKRPVFEIECDSSTLCFSNEPSLGHRFAPIMPREFVGYFLSDIALVKSYCENHLNFDAKDVASRIRVSGKNAIPRGSRSKPGPRSKPN